MTYRGYLLVLRETFVGTYEHRGFFVAKAAAYSALLSFFPVLTSAGAILVQAKAEFVSRTISEFLFEVVPPGTEELVRYQFTLKGQRPILLLVLAALLFGRLRRYRPIHAATVARAMVTIAHEAPRGPNVFEYDAMRASTA